MCFLDPILFAASLRLTPSGLSLSFDPIEWVRFAAEAVVVVTEGICRKVKVGHHEAGIGGLAAKLQAGDEAPFAVPRVGGVAEFMNTARLEAGFGKSGFSASGTLFSSSHTTTPIPAAATVLARLRRVWSRVPVSGQRGGRDRTGGDGVLASAALGGGGGG